MKISMFVATIDEPETSDLEVIDTETCRCLQDFEPNSPDSAWDYAYEVVEYFNDTLKPGETERMLISAREMT